jgi:hypothetical protein
MNKIDYLKTHLPICVSICDHDKKSLCGTCFTNNIILPYNNIPVCSICKEDTAKFRREIDKLKGRIVDSIEFKVDCTKFCLWFNWFHARRIEISNNIQIKYIRK